MGQGRLSIINDGGKVRQGKVRYGDMVVCDGECPSAGMRGGGAGRGRAPVALRSMTRLASRPPALDRS